MDINVYKIFVVYQQYIPSTITDLRMFFCVTIFIYYRWLMFFFRNLGSRHSVPVIQLFSSIELSSKKRKKTYSFSSLDFKFRLIWSLWICFSREGSNQYTLTALGLCNELTVRAMSSHGSYLHLTCTIKCIARIKTAIRVCIRSCSSWRWD